MNAILKRMFEDEDCSKEEAELKAAVLGKTYDECKDEWSKQFKKDFVLTNLHLVTSFSKPPEKHGKYWLILSMRHYGIYQTLIKNIMICDNVECTLENGLWKVAIPFHASEVDELFIDAVTAKTEQFSLDRNIC